MGVRARPEAASKMTTPQETDMTQTRAHRNLRSLGLGTLLIATATPGLTAETALGVYECHKNGVVTFSDQPCGPSAERIEVDYSKPDAARAEAAAARAGEAEAQASDAAEARLLDTEIENGRQRLSDLPIQRDAEIALLRQQRFLGTEALDQDAWKADMTRQMEAVAAKYQQSIDAEQARIDALKARRAALGAPR
jgi:hypothetical protein